MDVNRGAALSLLLAASASACSLAVTTNGLSGGQGSDGGSLAEAGDRAITAPSDADADAAAVADASDAGTESGAPTFLDSFTRDDGPIRNGWIEKGAGTFAIVGQRASVRSAAGYRDAVVYRPASEDLADVEVSVVVDATTFSGTYAQLHARVQRATVEQAGILDSYVLFVSAAPDEVILARTRGTTGPTTFADLALSAPLVAGERFRLRLRVTGASPVKVEGFVERVLAGGGGVVLGQATFLDADPMRLDAPGSVGFSADTGTGYFYDDFTRTAL